VRTFRRLKTNWSSKPVISLLIIPNAITFSSLSELRQDLIILLLGLIMLTHLSDHSLSLLLNIFNHIWSSGSFSPSWREATVIPIPKPGKDHSDPGNYRPIALTSCLCKTKERMVYERLYWKLEEVSGLAATQCGFRKQRSTVDHLVRLESFIRDAFINKEHVVAVLFDFEKRTIQPGNMVY
jgi:hypothetical protein